MFMAVFLENELTNWLNAHSTSHIKARAINELLSRHF
jgi:hypothetical protein